METLGVYAAIGSFAIALAAFALVTVRSQIMMKKACIQQNKVLAEIANRDAARRAKRDEKMASLETARTETEILARAAIHEVVTMRDRILMLRANQCMTGQAAVLVSRREEETMAVLLHLIKYPDMDRYLQAASEDQKPRDNAEEKTT